MTRLAWARNPDEYTGEFISVAGRISKFKGTSSYNFYFQDCLGRPGDGSGFLVYLDYKLFDLYCDEPIQVGDYVIVEGTWKFINNAYHLSEAVITDKGINAKRFVDEYISTWIEDSSKIAQTMPIISYENLIQNKEEYDGQYVRIVGIISACGFNNISNYTYFCFGDENAVRNYISISLEGCPQEMQEMCTDGEYYYNWSS